MQSTSMDGPIPSTIAQLKNLTELRISDLNGSSMKSSMKFPNLQELKILNTLILRNCLMTGPIPDYIGELPNLKLLDLSFNMLTGQIPGTLQSSNLNYMLLASNSLSGAVPDWILNSKNYGDISYNNFTESSLFGCQPSRVNLVSSHSSAASNTIDLATEGASYFYPSLQKWAYSSTGVFLGKSDASYRANNSFSLKLTGDYYETARLAPALFV